MMDANEWKIIFYMDTRGNSPVEDFLNELDAKTRARFLWALEQLRARNVHATEPLVGKVHGKLWELRRASDGNIFRVLYFFFRGRQIVLLSAFQKKTDKTPRQEIEVAHRRMEDFLNRAQKSE